MVNSPSNTTVRHRAEKLSVKMCTRNPSDFTVSQLRDKLRDMGHSLTGNKNDLIKRLIEVDPSGVWMTEVQEMPEASAAVQGDLSGPGVTAPTLASDHKREIEMYRREKN